MATKAHLARNERHRKTLDQIVITVPKGARAAIKEHAAKRNISVNSYITNLIEKDIGHSVEDLAKTNCDNAKSSNDASNT